ncbi:potassium channel family protein [Mycoplasma hafezii]|uniref:potassium channel family protein n=1 Tax=Mycoplasma hafezii TaxID=525886 RepID=UPI003CF7BA23
MIKKLKEQLKNVSKSTLWFGLTDIVWNRKSTHPDLKKYDKLITTLRWIYAITISISCLISFSSLFDITATWLKVIISLISVLTFFIFIIDYVAHMLTYSYASNYKGQFWKSYLRYLISWNAIIIFCCILASMHIIQHFGNVSLETKKSFDAFKTLNIARIIRLFMVLTIFAPFMSVAKVFESQKRILISVFGLIVILIILFSLVIWNNETAYLKDVTQREFAINWILSLQNNKEFPMAAKTLENKEWIHFLETQGFDLSKATDQVIVHNLLVTPFDKLQDRNAIDQETNGLITLTMEFLNRIQNSDYLALSNGYVTDFWTAIYFTTITLTTIGYGDYVPHAPVTRIIVMFISLLAIAIIAIPSGVIASSFLSEMQERSKQKRQKKTVIEKVEDDVNQIENKLDDNSNSQTNTEVSND